MNAYAKGAYVIHKLMLKFVKIFGLMGVKGSTIPNHSHKIRKGSLEARAVLLIFSLELQTSGMVVQRIHHLKWLLRGIAQ